MKRIVIDLNPDKKHALGENVQRVINFTPVLVLLSLGIFVLLVILQAAIIQKKHKLNESTIQEESWQEKANVIQLLKTEIFELEKEKNILREVIVSEDEVAKILNDIFSSMPKNIWFDSFNFNGEIISLAGYVVKWKEDSLASLEKFIGSLGNKQYFSSKFKRAHIVDSKKVDFNGVEVLKFNIECKK